MRASAICVLAGLTLLLAACKDTGNVRNFWNDTDINVTESNFAAMEDQFAQFAELLVKAPKEEAEAALDALMDKLKENEVSYYVFSDWFTMAFHSLLSPCRNPGLYAKCADRLKTDGILNESEYALFVDLADKDAFNAPGSPCRIPDITDETGAPVSVIPGVETLFLVLNLDCATCVAALRALSEKPGRHVALCFGHTPAPDIPGWEYYQPKDMDKFFDLDAAPFWFTVDEDGVVNTPYSLVPEYQGFATPDNQ